MIKSIILIAALCLAGRRARAQDPLTAAKKAAQKAAAASNAQTEAEQHPEGPQRPAAKAPAAAPLPAAVAHATPPSQTNPKGVTGAVKPLTPTPVPEATPTVMREEYVYSREGRRDPFVSLLTTNELRPTMSDLRLTGILFDHTGRNSVATLRDLTNNAQYRVTTGSALGRMRIAAIKTTTVVFTIEEFGTTRKDSLILRDSTKARVR